MKSVDKSTISLYKKYTSKYKKTFFTALIFIPLNTVLISTVLPYFISQAVGVLGTNPSHASIFLFWAATVSILGVLSNFIGFQAIVRHQADVATHLGNDTFKKIISKDMMFFANERIGALTSKFIDFSRGIIAIQDLFIIRTVGFVISLTLGVTILATKAPLLAIIVLTLLLLLIIQIRWSLKHRKKWREKRKKYRSEYFGKVADSITNSMLVKSFGMENYEYQTIQKAHFKFKKYFLKDFKFIATEGSVRIGLMAFMQIVAISYSVTLAQSGKIDLSTIIFSITYLQLVSSQIFNLADILNGYEQILLDASPMTEILHKEDFIQDAKSATTLHAKNGSVHFQNISYTYAIENTPSVINGVDLKIANGQKIGLVGHSGAGKSTLIALLLRFMDITDGEITIDNINIKNVTQESLRHNIAYVPQEPMMFHRSIRENIAYGKPDAKDVEIIAAAKKAHAWEFIKELPDGLDTLVGERGVKLSGGQRQRVAIARAILKDAPILVLDEATSALDSESEKLIQDALSELMKNRTSVVIAHRLSTIAKLDRIVVLEEGKIIEDGTHAELLKKKGTYAKLWSHQSGGFIEE